MRHERSELIMCIECGSARTLGQIGAAVAETS